MHNPSDAPLKILHLHFGKEGGAERFFVNLATGLHGAGVEQRFVIRPGRSWDAEISALGPVIRHNYRRIDPTSLLLRWRVALLARSWKPNVIMAWIPRAAHLVPNFAGALKLTRLGDYPRHIRHFRYCDLIVVNAPGIAERCVELGWEKPVRVISNFARTVSTEPVSRAEMTTPENAFVVVGSGRFVARKGFDTLVRAVSKIPDAWLWLVGDGDRKAELEQLVQELGMAERTRFTGWVQEPMRYVASASAFVIPSRHEPLGNVILEAWQVGAPVVSTRSEGPSWFVKDGEDALMCDIDDGDAMAQAICRIRDEEALAGRLRQAGRHRVETDFSEAAILNSYLALFHRKQ